MEFLQILPLGSVYVIGTFSSFIKKKAIKHWKTGLLVGFFFPPHGPKLPYTAILRVYVLPVL